MKRRCMLASVMIVVVAAAGACSERRDPNLVRMAALTEDGIGPGIGTVRVTETPHGVLFTPDLRGLPPGLHGFHLHAEGNCAAAEKDGAMVPGMAAGGHYDPDGTNAHRGPFGDGHRGDLPALYVDRDGLAVLPVLAPRLTLSDVTGRALVIHAGGDNYSDTPRENGGGGDRIACGVFGQ